VEQRHGIAIFLANGAEVKKNPRILVKNALGRRKDHQTFGSWLCSEYMLLLDRLPNAPLPGRGCAFKSARVGAPRNIFCRQGTTDPMLLENIYLDHEYAELTEKISAPVRTVLDLGANVGYTVRLWQSTFPGCRVIAVEPDAGNLRVLCRNVQAGPAPEHVDAIHAFAAGRPGTASLDRSGGAWGYRKVDGAGAEAISAFTVDQILRESRFGSGAVDLLKCDIEGAEKEVFADCAGWIAGVRNLVVETHQGYAAADLLRDISRAGANFRRVSVTPKSPEMALVFAFDNAEASPT
jgi:FkbM family methyltransferase